MGPIRIPDSALCWLQHQIKIKRCSPTQSTQVSRVWPYFVTVAPDVGLRMLTFVLIWKSRIRPLVHRYVTVVGETPDNSLRDRKSLPVNVSTATHLDSSMPTSLSIIPVESGSANKNPTALPPQKKAILTDHRYESRKKEPHRTTRDAPQTSSPTPTVWRWNRGLVYDSLKAKKGRDAPPTQSTLASNQWKDADVTQSQEVAQ